jgi:cellulose synthase/poly-beta-1,6-N-acetylglucosamine synthase-like glycosyltransferase
MYSNLAKIVSYFLYALMVISVVLAVLFYFGKVVPGTEGTNMHEPTITKTFLLWAGILTGLIALLSLVFPIINLVSHPKAAKKTLITIVGVAILIFVAWMLAADAVLDIPQYEGKENVPKILKLAGTGLYTTYILAGLAILSILYSEISKYFK